MAYDAELAQRVRERMTAVAGVSEKKMFGGLAFLTSGNMTVGVYGEGLIVRINPAAMDAALADPPAGLSGGPVAALPGPSRSSPSSGRSATVTTNH
jgi:TfoX/Sxy family transcriptional regulator of competence genes